MKSKTNIRIVDIAQMAGVSVGTVDRILHNRGHVSDGKKEKVEKVLKEINYQPNMVARFLASKKSYTFAAITPSYTQGSYWQLTCDGMERAVNELNKFNVTVDYYYFDQYDKKSFLKAAKKLLENKYDGVIIATHFEDYVINFSNKLNEAGIPYIYIDSNIFHQNDLAYFGGDSYACGQVAGRLLMHEIGTNSDIFFAHIKFHHNEISVQMKSRELGFMQFLQNNKFKGNIHHLEIDPDNSDDSIKKLAALFSANSRPIGGIVLNSRIYELIKLMDKVDNNLTKDVKLIGHDVINSNIQALKEGKITFLLSQRPDLQGYDAVKTLGNYLLFNQIPDKDNYMPIDILMKENIDYYNNYKL